MFFVKIINPNYMLRFISLFLLLCLTTFSSAHDEISLKFLSGTQIAENNVLSVEDDRYAFMSDPANQGDWFDYNSSVGVLNRIFGNFKSRGILSLDFTNSDNNFYGSDWALSVEVSVIAYSSTGTVIHDDIETLDLSYTTDGNTAYNSYFDYPNAHRLDISINSVVATGALSTITNLPNDFILNSSIEVERYYILNVEEVPLIGNNISSIDINNWDNRVSINWSYISGAEEFELQYVHVSDQLVDNDGQPISVELFKDYNNSTRVILSDQHFELPMIYESGTIFYRVRGIGRTGTNFEKSRIGAWSAEGAITIGDGAMLPPFEENKNWTYAITHAENGKHVEQTVYFDGTGQVKQTVAIDNEDGIPIITESRMDYEGRPAVSFMPGLNLANHDQENQYNLKYQESFGTLENSSSVLFNKEHFDTDEKRYAPDGLGTGLGSVGNFTSADNPLAASGMNRHIAKSTAPGNESSSYAYTRTLFDRQGRVKEQSGIGETHKIGEDHTTKYFYSKPSQEKLDRLFGAEVGYAKHYKKTVVQDANGQLSVSYQNLGGQVIATSLLGGTPKHEDESTMVESLKIEDLNNEKGIYGVTTIDIGEHNQYLESDNEWIISHPLMVSQINVDYVFQYLIDLSDKNFLSTCNTEDICRYELDIRIVDDEGEEIPFSISTEEGNPGVYLNGDLSTPQTNFSSTDFPVIVEATNAYDLDFTLSFGSIGTYTIEKTLKIYQSGVDLALTGYQTQILDFENNFCITPIEIASDCNGLIITDDIPSDDYPIALDCETLRDIFKADMAPGGQYFDNLRFGNQTPNDDWMEGIRFPYDDGNGPVRRNVILGNEVIGAFNDDLLPVINLDPAINLADISEINEAWSIVRDNYDIPEVVVWLESLELERFHPEYGHYEWCLEQQLTGDAENDYINDLTVDDDGTPHTINSVGWSIAKINAITNAVLIDDHQDLNPSNSNAAINNLDPDSYPLIASDPYFSGDLGSRMVNGEINGKELMALYIQCLPVNEVGPNGETIQFMTMWQRATDMASRIENGSVIPGTEEEIWSVFLSLYQSQKALIIRLQKKNPCQNSFYSPFAYDHSVIDPDPNIDEINDMLFPDNIADLRSNYLETPWAENIYCFDGDNSDNLHPFFEHWDQNCNTPINNDNDANIGVYWPAMKALMTEWNANDYDNSEGRCTNESNNNLALEIFDRRIEGFSIRVPDLEQFVSETTSANNGNNGGIPGSAGNIIGIDPTADNTGFDPASNISNVSSPCAPGSVGTEGGFYLKFRDRLGGNNSGNNNDWPTSSNPKTGAEIKNALISSGVDKTFSIFACDDPNAANRWDSADPSGCFYVDTDNDAISYEDFNSFFNDYISFLNCYVEELTDENSPEVVTVTYDSEGLQFAWKKPLNQDHEWRLGVDRSACFNGCDPLPFGGSKRTCAVYNERYCDQPIPHCLCENYNAANAALANADLGVTLIDLYQTTYPEVDPNFNWSGYLTAVSNTCDILNDASVPFIDDDEDDNDPTNDREDAIEAIEALTPEGVDCFNLDPDPCDEGITIADYYEEEHVLDQYNSLSEAFVRDFSNFCIDPTTKPDQLKVTYPEDEYNFTLYYYSPAGNLYATVPPEAVRPLPDDPAILTSIATDRQQGIITLDNLPKHRHNAKRDNQMMTIYEYDSYNNIVKSVNPDHVANSGQAGDGRALYGATYFMYDDVGRIRFSQNPKQEEDNDISFTKYDPLGRVVESGETNINSLIFNNLNPNDEDASGQTYPPNTQTLKYLNRIKYDSPSGDAAVVGALGTMIEGNTRQRVAYTEYWEALIANAQFLQTPSHATYYNYSIRGEVNKVVQRDFSHINPLAQIKTIDYDYGVLDGLVYKMTYQEGARDQFIHEYCYDGNNRLVKTLTSTDGIFKTKQARSFYRLDGVMAREEVGYDIVQGIDYAYSIHGWIKGVNSSTLKPDLDIGNDGNLNTTDAYNQLNRWAGRDAAGYGLHYYPGDYSTIQSTADDFLATIPSNNGIYQMFGSNSGIGGLYNGNIAAMQTGLKKTQGEQMEYILKGYRYDQLHRIRASYSATAPANTGGVFNNNAWTSSMNTQEYATSYEYDWNGNLQKLERSGGGAGNPLEMDDLTYQYPDLNNFGKINNRLKSVDDEISSGNYPNDFEDQDPNNYEYDQIGNLIRDIKEDVTIEWNVANKVTRIINNSRTYSHIEFKYDSNGNRIEKRELIESPVSDGFTNSTLWKSTLYVRDPQGNVLATYNREFGIPVDAYYPPPGSNIARLDRAPQNPASYLSGDERLIIGDFKVNLSNVIFNDVDRLAFREQGAGDSPPPYDGWSNSYAEEVYLKERHLYANKRIGLIGEDKLVDLAYFNGDVSQDSKGFDNINNVVSKQIYEVDKEKKRKTGKTYYELSNHLGNVLAVITDKKIGVSSDNLKVDYYEADVVSATDYYPFGWEMPGRKYNSAEYRYGFNGKEKDDEGEFGSITNYDYGFRIYNPAVGRFLSVDPLQSERSWMSPYNFVQNSPLSRIDPTGAIDESAQQPDGEFEWINGEWVKTSTLGDDIGVNFYHLDNVPNKENSDLAQITYIFDGKGNSNRITDGRKWLSATQRDDNTNYLDIYWEFAEGTGPENSLFLNDHPMNIDLVDHYLFRREARKFEKSGKERSGGITGFNLADAFFTLTDKESMQTQMMGNYNLNFYRLGEVTLVLAIDTKNRTSLYYHLPFVNNYSRSEGVPISSYNSQGGRMNTTRSQQETNTHQIYMFLGKTTKGFYKFESQFKIVPPK